MFHNRKTRSFACDWLWSAKLGASDWSYFGCICLFATGWVSPTIFKFALSCLCLWFNACQSLSLFLASSFNCASFWELLLLTPRRGKLQSFLISDCNSFGFGGKSSFAELAESGSKARHLLAVDSLLWLGLQAACVLLETSDDVDR